MQNLENNFYNFLSLFIAKRLFISLLISLMLFFVAPGPVQSQLQSNKIDENHNSLRSLESLRDLDYQNWQVVVYRSDLIEDMVVLRIVGYPGSLRLDHPTDILVHSGRKDWILDDVTLLNDKLSKDPREAAAEFDITPLLLFYYGKKNSRRCLVIH